MPEIRMARPKGLLSLNWDQIKNANKIFRGEQTQIIQTNDN